MHEVGCFDHWFFCFCFCFCFCFVGAGVQTSKKIKFPSLKKGIQKRLGMGKYATAPNPKANKNAPEPAPAPVEAQHKRVFFGTPLSLQPTNADHIPIILISFLEYFYGNKCYELEGLFRIVGSTLQVQDLQKKCDEGEFLDCQRIRRDFVGGFFVFFEILNRGRIFVFALLFGWFY
jgi:hypothetical protein